MRRDRRRSLYDRQRDPRSQQTCSMAGCIFMIMFMVWTMLWHWIGGRGHCDRSIGVFVSWILIVPFARIIIYTAYALLCCFHNFIGNEIRFSLLVYMGWNMWGTYQVVSSHQCPRFEWYSGLIIGTLVWLFIFTLLACWACVKLNPLEFARWMCSRSWMTSFFLIHTLLPYFANDREKRIIRDVAQQFGNFEDDDEDLLSNAARRERERLRIVISNLPTRKLANEDFSSRTPTGQSSISEGGDGSQDAAGAKDGDGDDSQRDGGSGGATIAGGGGGGGGAFVQAVANRLRDPLRADYEIIPDWTCTVCLEDFVIDEVVTTLPCLHEYHESCIRSWFATGNSSCPLCRYDLTTVVVDPSSV